MLDKFLVVLQRRAPRVYRLFRGLWNRNSMPVPKIVSGSLFWVHPKLLRRRVTETHILCWLRSSLKAGDVVFDVGAHFGWMSLVAARKVTASGKVVAFEPSPPLVDMLLYHKRANRLDQLEVLAQAVAEHDSEHERMTLVDTGLSSMNSLVMHSDLSGIEPARVSVVEVRTTTLDTYWRKSGICPSLVKIDAEGAELQILHGAQSLLEECHPSLIVAVHPLWLPHGETPEQLFDLLKKLGYRVWDSYEVDYQNTKFGDYFLRADAF
jgi:FkbM family methyltransferase